MIVSRKRVLITGGTTGIGRAIAEQLALEGARILILGRDISDLDSAVADIAAKGGSIHGLQADASIEADVASAFRDIQTKWDGMDILICNAAVAADGIADMADKDWRYAIEVNIVGYLACCKFGVQMMNRQQSGHIIMIGSMSSEVREKGSSVYVASKGAIQAFAASLRKEVNDWGIRVSLIEPGSVTTDMASGSEEEQERAVLEEKMLLPTDIAECVRFVIGLPPRCDVVTMQVRPHRQLI